MSTQIALTGLKAAQADISNTSHNIANVGTTGFQRSRVEFGDLFSTSPMANPRTQIGSGTKLLATQRIFEQGAVTTTGNAFDLALEGPGFFALQGGETGGRAYSRAGAFNLDPSGRVIDSSGDFLLGFPVAQNGTPLSRDPAAMRPIQIASQTGAARATSTVELDLNFPASGQGRQATVPSAVGFNPGDPTSYAYSTPMSILDADGQPVDAIAYFVKTAEPSATSTDSTFEVQLSYQGSAMTPPATPPELTFDAFGTMTGGFGPMTFTSLSGPLTMDFTGSQMSNDAFSVRNFEQDGETKRSLSNLEIANDGVVWATYGTQEAIAIGQVGLANFANPNGLKQIGNATFVETSESGQPDIGQGGASGFGSIRSGALESSNVDLTAELVHLITAQRNYQASAKALETSSSLSQTIMNMRT
ncbi:flagellar hook protein FlgE [Meridianimarinicoccus roseus]|jgi:flagellar hook protein FlgE|uniref:Flagellar hook protein FlgE n=1 Tax=Meridianimarinicoccus roseus TaxID=2072018 RepID=A0A2V2LFA3_9RHOB|nr:flagellar hook protein FlgE [Meridianimarinicoccus roseus]PWR02571.1 flagellar hook protein FlgE [Meridianimarinicoccus roseus]